MNVFLDKVDSYLNYYRFYSFSTFHYFSTKIPTFVPTHILHDFMFFHGCDDVYDGMISMIGWRWLTFYDFLAVVAIFVIPCPFDPPTHRTSSLL